MKTPKRKGTSTPPDSVKDYEQRARWKRKNKVSQLKRKIARQRRCFDDFMAIVELHLGDIQNTTWWQDQEGS